jgi:hypothetical protein
MNQAVTRLRRADAGDILAGMQLAVERVGVIASTPITTILPIPR